MISSSLMAWCGVIGVEAAAVHIYIYMEKTLIHGYREKFRLKQLSYALVVESTTDMNQNRVIVCHSTQQPH